MVFTILLPVIWDSFQFTSGDAGGILCLLSGDMGYLGERIVGTFASLHRILVVYFKGYWILVTAPPPYACTSHLSLQ